MIHVIEAPPPRLRPQELCLQPSCNGLSSQEHLHMKMLTNSATAATEKVIDVREY